MVKVAARESAKLFAKRIISEANDARPNLGTLLIFIGLVALQTAIMAR